MKYPLMLILVVGFLSFNSCSKGELETLQTSENQGDDALFYSLVLFDASDLDINAYKEKINSFNQSTLGKDQLRVTALWIGQNEEERTPIMTVRRFNTSNEAAKYTKQLSKKLKVNKDPNIIQVVYLTQNEYREVLRAKSIESLID